MAKYDNIVTSSSHLDILIVPRLRDSRLLNIVKSVHNRAKGISQSSTSRMTRESSSIDLIINPIRLNILTIFASILLRGMTTQPSSPYILRPNTRLHVWQLCKAHIIEVSSSWNHTFNNSMNLCFEHIRFGSFYGSQEKGDYWSNDSPESIIYNSKESSYLSTVETGSIDTNTIPILSDILCEA